MPLADHARAVAPGSFRLDDLDIPLAGHWQLSLDVHISDFDKRRFDLGLPIP